MPARAASPRDRFLLALLATLLTGSLAMRLWSAVDRPHAGRFFDERYTFANVEAVLRGDGLRPANGFYLGLSYLPQSALLAASEALHEGTGNPLFAVWTADGKGFSPTAYVLCRTLNALVGAASLWLTFLVGRALWSPAAGLLAATALAAAPRHLRCSVEYKPDIWVVALSLLAFLWALDAGERPSLRRFLRAGLATGLAISAKYTGIGAAMAVAAAGLARGGWRQARRWGWMVLSAGAALLTYLSLNPYLGLILPYVPRVMAGYLRQSKRQGLSHVTLPLQEVRFLVDNLGVLVALVALAGLAHVLARAARRWRTLEPVPLGELMLLVQLVGYSLFYASATRLFRGQNYLPVVPLACLLAAFAAVTAAAQLARRVPQLVSARPASLALLVALSLASQGRQVYRGVVPTTWRTAARELAAAIPSTTAGQVVFERGEAELRLAGLQWRPLLIEVGRLSAASAELLDGSDAEVFPAARLEGSDGPEYLRRTRGSPAPERRDLVARALRLRGEQVTLLLHPWQPIGQARWVDGRDQVQPLPATGAREMLSVEVELRGRIAGATPPRLRLDPGGGELPLHGIVQTRRRWLLRTLRFAPGPAETVSLQTPRGKRDVAWRVVRWRRASPAGG